MKITEIRLKAYSSNSDITTVWGYYFDSENHLHTIENSKYVIESFKDLLTVLDMIAGAYIGYEYDTLNGQEGDEFTRIYYPVN